MGRCLCRPQWGVHEDFLQIDVLKPGQAFNVIVLIVVEVQQRSYISLHSLGISLLCSLVVGALAAMLKHNRDVRGRVSSLVASSAY